MDNPIEKAVQVLGSQKALADSLGVPPSVVCQWISGYRKVPPKHCRTIEALVQGEVTAEQLRPDIFLPPSKVA